MSDDVPTYSTGPIYGTASWGNGKPMTIADLVALKEKLGPPPPPVDPKRCGNCGRSIGRLTAHGITTASFPTGSPIAYLCWWCIDALKDHTEKQ